MSGKNKIDLTHAIEDYPQDDMMTAIAETAIANEIVKVTETAEVSERKAPKNAVSIGPETAKVSVDARGTEIIRTGKDAKTKIRGT